MKELIRWQVLTFTLIILLFRGAVLNAEIAASGPISVVNRWTFISRKTLGFEIPPQERTRPILVGDILYFSNSLGRLVAMHRFDDYVFWEKHFNNGIDGSLAYGRSKLFIGDLAGKFSALEARDGTPSWEFTVQSEWLAPAFIVRDRVYMISAADDLYVLKGDNGEKLGQYSRRGTEKMVVRGTASPSGLSNGSEIVQGFSDGYVAALTGTLDRSLWPPKSLRSRSRGFYDIDTTAYVDEKDIIVGTFDGSIYSLDRTTGDTNWVLRVGNYSGFLVEGQVVYFSGLNGYFYALDKATGSVKWKTPFEKGVGMTPVRVGDYLVITTSDDPVYLLDANDGHVVWKQSLGAGSFAPAVGHPDGWFYCMSNFGNLYAFEITKASESAGRRGILHTPTAFRPTEMQ